MGRIATAQYVDDSRLVAFKEHSELLEKAVRRLIPFHQVNSLDECTHALSLFKESAVNSTIIFSPKPTTMLQSASIYHSGWKVPPEVIIIIMQHLADDRDTASLKSCARVCWGFVDMCYRHIFSEIKLSDSPQLHSAPRTRQYRRFLEKRAHIARHVRTVEYINDAHAPLSAAPVLRYLHDVRALIFGFSNTDAFAGDRQRWDALPPKLARALCYFVQTNALTTLHLRSVAGVPAALFAHLPALSVLELVNVSVAHTSPPICFRKPAARARLRSLYVHDALGAVLKLCHGAAPVVDFSGLEMFSVITDGRSMETVGQVLALSSHLESVEIRGHEIDFKDNFARHISTGSRQSLRRISLVVELEGGDDPFKHFAGELEQMAGYNAIEEIALTLNVQTDSMCTMDAGRWAALDTVCSQPDALPFIHTVEISVNTFSCAVDYSELHSALQGDIRANAFQNLGKAEHVDFHFTVTGFDI